MSLTISRFEDIDLLESINGVPIIEIERRSRPLIRDEISNEFKYDPVEFPRTVEEEDYTNLLRETRSQIGFLGPNEKLKDVLKQDWKIVSELNLSHSLIAQYLRQLLQICGQSNYIPNFTYDASTLPNTTIKASKPQRFSIRRFVTRGYQYSVFTNLESEEPAESWNEEYHIRNLDLDLELQVAGNCDVGVIAYIERYGFYEGGKGTNELRVDPEKVFTMLTGVWTKSVLALEIQNYEQKVAKTTMSIQELSGKLEEYMRELEEKKATRNAENEVEIEMLEGDILYCKSEIREQRNHLQMLSQKLNKLIKL